jgi:hypothetical protein
MATDNNWEVRALESGAEAEVGLLLPLLATNRIAAIRIPNFFTKEDLDNCTRNIGQKNISWYANKEFKQGRIGISTTEYHYKENGKKLYFELAPQASAVRDEIFHGMTNPIEKIIKLLSVRYKTSIATESSMNHAPYFAGLIRAMGAKSTLHFDYAPNQLPGWDVSNSEEQFGLVLYLQMPPTGGELLIYNHPWSSDDEIYNKDVGQKGTYGFDPVFLRDEVPAKVSPVAGDLIIFRTRNFHQIEEIDSDKPRLTLVSFITLKEGSLSLWS